MLQCFGLGLVNLVIVCDGCIRLYQPMVYCAVLYI